MDENVGKKKPDFTSIDAWIRIGFLFHVATGGVLIIGYMGVYSVMYIWNILSVLFF